MKKFVKIPREKVDEIVKGMVEVRLGSLKNSDGVEYGNTFKIVRDMLTRIGVLKNNKIYQSVHILQKQGKHYLAHFKQLFALDGAESTFSDLDRKRLIKISYLIQKQGLLEVVDQDIFKTLESEENNVYVHFVRDKDIRDGLIQKVKKYDL